MFMFLIFCFRVSHLEFKKKKKIKNTIKCYAHNILAQPSAFIVIIISLLCHLIWISSEFSIVHYWLKKEGKQISNGFYILYTCLRKLQKLLLLVYEKIIKHINVTTPATITLFRLFFTPKHTCKGVLQLTFYTTISTHLSVCRDQKLFSHILPALT